MSRPKSGKASFCFVCLLLFFLGVGSPLALARDITPIGAQVATDAQGHAVYQASANGILIGYKLIGSGEPLLLLTGLGNTMDHWPPEFLEEAAKHYQVILMDNRGMGYTTDDGRQFTYRLFAQDVVSLLTALGVENANVLGYSQSSVTTQNVLLLSADRVKKAILFATSTDGKQVAAALRHKGAPDNPTIAKQLQAAAGWKTPLRQMQRIKKPVMLLVGTNDTVVGTKSSKMLADLIPGAWLVQFQGATHRLHFEAPAAFTRVVLTFLAQDETVPAGQHP